MPGFKQDYLQVFQVHSTIYSYLFPYVWYAHYNKCSSFYPIYPTVSTQKYISSSPHGIYNSNCYLTKVYTKRSLPRAMIDTPRHLQYIPLHDICRPCLCLPLHDICVQGTPCTTSCSLGQPTSQWVLPRRDI